MPAVRRSVLRSYMPMALAASNVGTWDFDVPGDRVRYDEVIAALFGLDPSDGARGLPLQRFIEAVHPDDVAVFRRKVARVLEQGGHCLLEYRTRQASGETCWVLARGRFDADAVGRIVSGRGICIDITESKRDGAGEDRALFLASSEAPPLDRAAEHAIAARKAIDEIGGGESHLLRQAVDALLWALGRCLAGRVERPHA